jgi:hypothetical protein
MESTDGMSSENTPSLLYHTTLKVTKTHPTTSGDVQQTYVLGTHATLKAAKSFARAALASLGYSRDDFEIYSERSECDSWAYGDGVIIYSRAASGEEFRVAIDTKFNDQAFLCSPNGTLKLPAGTEHLHYVLQTTTDYKADQAVSTEIEGAYAKRADALAAALQCLLVKDGSIKKNDYAQYDEREDLKPQADWPFGDDAIVHAIAQTGENYLVEVKTVPGVHHHHKRHLTTT